MGQTILSMIMDDVQLYRYTGQSGVVALSTEIACCVFVLVITAIELRNLNKQGCSYFKSFWNTIQIISLTLFIIAVGLYVTRSVWTVRVVDDLKNNPGSTAFFFRNLVQLCTVSNCRDICISKKWHSTGQHAFYFLKYPKAHEILIGSGSRSCFVYKFIIKGLSISTQFYMLPLV